MPRLGASAQATVEQFASQMDIQAYEAPDGAYSFDFERRGRFSVLANEEGEIVLSLTARILLSDLRGYAQLAQLGGYDRDRDLLVHCGLNRSGQPVLALRTEARTFSLPVLLEALEILSHRLRGWSG
jgi:hypothetical protein